jgi:hypothetical protein
MTPVPAPAPPQIETGQDSSRQHPDQVEIAQDSSSHNRPGTRPISTYPGLPSPISAKKQFNPNPDRSSAFSSSEIPPDQAG